MANVFNRMSMFVQRGQPTRKGYKRLRFALADYYNPDWHSLPEGEGWREPHDHEFYTFTELFV